jgi:murein DD-endopeptidase MepM/ murein hydrolase activator NlpD
MWPGHVSLPLAGHAITVAVVLAVALGARAPERLLRSPVVAVMSPATPVDPSAADILVPRSIVAPLAASAADTPAARLPDAQSLPAFTESHTLSEGETLGQVAAQYHVSVAAIFWSNNLGSGTVFAAGQELRIPRLSGIPHIIQDGETLDSIAEQFHVPPQAIELFKPNNVQPAQPLPVGREIFIPGAALPYPEEVLAKYGGEQGLNNLVAVAAGLVQEAETNIRTGPGRDYPTLGTLDAGRRLKLLARHDGWVKVEHGADQVGWVRADLLGLSQEQLGSLAETSDFPPPPVRWMWPTHGEITSPFGWRSAPFRSFHDGLDIANAAWTKIYAARRGRVVESGWCSGFGYCVKIDHGDGVTTIYGHMIKKPPVKVGDIVDAGDLIGYMGSTFDRSGGGYSTGVHLHFTIKVNGKAVNPLKFLP